jgi:hypothetical protein
VRHRTIPICSRLRLHPSFLVPSGIASAGGLAVTAKLKDGEIFVSGLEVGFRMMTVSIGELFLIARTFSLTVCAGITVGIFTSAFLVYSFFGAQRRSGALFSF